MVERLFRDITTERLGRGMFTSVAELEAAINEYVAHHNTRPKPFIRTKGARDILRKVVRANSRLGGSASEVRQAGAAGWVSWVRFSSSAGRQTR
jgi:hypothetical protein